MIVAGYSAYSRNIDFKRFREIADSVGAFLMADIAHPAGLIAKGLLNDPIPHCHFVTTTTHKTLRGPRGGMIMMGKDFENPFGLKTPKGGNSLHVFPYRPFCIPRKPRRAFGTCDSSQSRIFWRSPLG